MNSVRDPLSPKNRSATPSLGVHEETPHQVTVLPGGYIARRSSCTPLYSFPVNFGNRSKA
eukprot:CAMPEP_0170195398 /NCGR_PEP_ID=MMETSP0040_2-20121228/61451_1 /TAXON_ID=641309 /ORGANISM="Lotharella oceanica, Strain CCMP622" /LENGTH=59 /DNA_ID=CAMNT_0010444553 /DNA_START=63 /DNA_END=239 /DNA_ORIENTATION=+